MSTAFCPSCGANLCPSPPVADGPFHYDGGSVVTFNGDRLMMRPNCVIAVGTLMQARGRPVSREVLMSRLDVRSSAGLNVALSQARAAARRVGARLPIDVIRSRGYRWRRGSAAGADAARLNIRPPVRTGIAPIPDG